MPIFEKNGERILFVHIPKTGGSSIEAHFIECGYNVSFIRGVEFGKLIKFDMNNGCTPQHMHSELIDRHIGNQNFDFEFAITRNPIARFYSEFRFRLEQNHRLAQDNVDLFADTILEKYQTNPFILDNHIRPQNEFLRPSTHTFYLEDGMTPVLDFLSKELTNFDYTRQKFERTSSDTSGIEMSEKTRTGLNQFYQKDFGITR